jgi:hypothetical protein
LSCDLSAHRLAAGTSIGAGQRLAGWAILTARSDGVTSMRHSPSIVPEDSDRDVYLVLEDF